MESGLFDIRQKFKMDIGEIGILLRGDTHLGGDTHQGGDKFFLLRHFVMNLFIRGATISQWTIILAIKMMIQNAIMEFVVATLTNLAFLGMGMKGTLMMS
jgi:hypothetical protein